MQKLYCRAYKKSPNNRRLNNSVKLLDSILAKHCKVLVCRIDLSANGLVGHHMIAKLVRMLKSRYGIDFYGYVYSCEYGLEVGKHYHVMFFLNGSKYKSHYCRMLSVKKMWLDICGMYSFIPMYSSKLGLIKTTGIVRRGNNSEYKNVIYALSYLCKNAQKIGGRRDFSMTQVSRLKNRSKKKHTRRVAVRLN